MTETESKWAERIRQWRASGKTAEEFATGQGFEGSTLRYWSSELNRRTRESKPVAAPARAVRATPRVRVVRVRASSLRAADALMIVAVGAARIELHAGFDRALLREVVDALGATS